MPTSLSGEVRARASRDPVRARLETTEEEVLEVGSRWWDGGLNVEPTLLVGESSKSKTGT